jgi:hypothetical protein
MRSAVGVETGATAQGVDRLETAGGHQPRERVVGDAVAGPLLQRRAEGVVRISVERTRRDSAR